MMKEYIQCKSKSILLLTVCFLVQFVVFYLYDYDISAVLYVYVLCALFVLVILLIDGSQYKRKKNELQSFIHKPSLQMSDFREPSDLYEKDYQGIIQAIIEEKNEIESHLSKKCSDSTDYFTMWVHQIKTPIAAMQLLLQSDSEMNKAEIEEQCFKIEQYVEMVLQYIRMQETSRDFVFETIELDKIVKQSIRKYAKSFIRKKIKLNVEETSLCVTTDEKWVCFVIEQLLSNAIKYTPVGGEVAITYEGNKCFIKDTGIGISQEDIPRIFERGFTGYNGRVDKKSTGIGLFLCKTICDQLGHRIEIESVVGSGTIVKLYFDTKLTKA